MWWLVGVALASDPAVHVDPDGTVVAVVTVSATVDAVRAALSDGERVARMSPDLYAVSATSDGRCEVMTKEVRGLLRPFHLRTRRCPTASGFTEVLVDSEDFRSYASSFDVAPSDGGAVVTMRTRTELAALVPASLVQRALSDASVTVLQKLAQQVAPGR